MCLAIPAEIISAKNKKFIVRQAGQKKEISGSLVKAKAGDYVILQNNFIVRKISKKSAQNIIKLLQSS